ncbi:invasion associated locus B family protein [Acidocella facilis]|uniref:invasion associated locus B family protein n=1 Tax=Acidocella facilis TaxID=525 RepID=UPI00047A05D2|nr:invasion associated locus B family protein [Acidocella facilis]
MKRLLATSLLALLPASALAAGPTALGPNGGKYGDWTAATYGTGAAKICYAFTTVQSAKPAIASRGKVMLTVTNRKGSANEVSVTAGYDYPKDAKVKLSVGPQDFGFYTQKNVAFTADGAKAVAAFKSGNDAVVTSPGPKGKITVTDQFSLSGFSAAYKAISDACQ